MERLIGYLLAVPGQDWPVGAHRTDAIASAIAGDRNRAMFVGAPDRHALLRQDVQYLLVCGRPKGLPAPVEMLNAAVPAAQRPVMLRFCSHGAAL